MLSRSDSQLIRSQLYTSSDLLVFSVLLCLEKSVLSGSNLKTAIWLKRMVMEIVRRRIVKLLYSFQALSVFVVLLFGISRSLLDHFVHNLLLPSLFIVFHYLIFPFSSLVVAFIDVNILLLLLFSLRRRLNWFIVLRLPGLLLILLLIVIVSGLETFL